MIVLLSTALGGCTEPKSASEITINGAWKQLHTYPVNFDSVDKFVDYGTDESYYLKTELRSDYDVTVSTVTIKVELDSLDGDEMPLTAEQIIENAYLQGYKSTNVQGDTLYFTNLDIHVAPSPVLLKELTLKVDFEVETVPDYGMAVTFSLAPTDIVATTVNHEPVASIGKTNEITHFIYPCLGREFADIEGTEINFCLPEGFEFYLTINQDRDNGTVVSIANAEIGEYPFMFLSDEDELCADGACETHTNSRGLTYQVIDEVETNSTTYVMDLDEGKKLKITDKYLLETLEFGNIAGNTPAEIKAAIKQIVATMAK